MYRLLFLFSLLAATISGQERRFYHFDDLMTHEDFEGFETDTEGVFEQIYGYSMQWAIKGPMTPNSWNWITWQVSRAQDAGPCSEDMTFILFKNMRVYLQSDGTLSSVREASLTKHGRKFFDYLLNVRVKRVLLPKVTYNFDDDLIDTGYLPLLLLNNNPNPKPSRGLMPSATYFVQQFDPVQAIDTCTPDSDCNSVISQQPYNNCV